MQQCPSCMHAESMPPYERKLEFVHCVIATAHPKTFRKWAWCVVHQLSSFAFTFLYIQQALIDFVLQIGWEARKQTSFRVDGKRSICYPSLDATDCTICEPIPFREVWWSHKIEGPALRYELCVSIAGDIFWINGPFSSR